MREDRRREIFTCRKNSEGATMSAILVAYNRSGCKLIELGKSLA